MYKVNFVSDEDFEKLPGKDMHTKIGVAYPNHGEAYVRQSGSSTMDVFTALHELEHLKGSDLDEHFDSENGCYYKDFGSTMSAAAPFLAAIPGIGPLLSAGAGIGGGMMSQNYQGKQQRSAMEQQQQNSMYGQNNYGAQAAAPATMQTGAGPGGGASAGRVGGGALDPFKMKMSDGYEEIQRQRSGSLSGRDPLMNAFGG